MEKEARKLQGGGGGDDDEKVQPDYLQDGVDARYNAGHNGKRVAMDAVSCSFWLIYYWLNIEERDPNELTTCFVVTTQMMRSNMNIVVTQRHDLTKLEQQQQDAKDVYAPTSSRNRPKVNRERFQLSQQEGEVHFRTDEHDGFVEICLQSYIASQQTPTRMALRISSSEENYQIFQQVATAAAAAATKKEQSQTTATNSTMSNLIEGETNYLVSELSRMERMTMDVFRKIQASTKREVEFREQSVKLNRAVRNWPIFRILCLLVGGYFQVSSVLDYMKRKHIY